MAQALLVQIMTEPTLVSIYCFNICFGYSLSLGVGLFLKGIWVSITDAVPPNLFFPLSFGSGEVLEMPLTLLKNACYTHLHVV